MADVKWSSYSGVTTYLAAEINALGDDNNDLGVVIDNTSDLHLFMDVEVYLPQIDLSAKVNPAVYLWLLTSVDGINYEDGGDALDPIQNPTRVIAIDATDAVHRRVARGILLTPGKYKLLIGNRTGAAFAGTLNTVKYVTYYTTVG